MTEIDAWRGKRIDDMDADELRVALRKCGGMYTDLLRERMPPMLAPEMPEWVTDRRPGAINRPPPEFFDMYPCLFLPPGPIDLWNVAIGAGAAVAFLIAVAALMGLGS